METLWKMMVDLFGVATAAIIFEFIQVLKILATDYWWATYPALIIVAMVLYFIIKYLVHSPKKEGGGHAQD